MPSCDLDSKEVKDMAFPSRHTLRLAEYDYSTPGAYFITFCTHGRRQTLLRIVGAIHESPLRSRSIISKAVGYIKMNASKRIHERFGPTDVWQRGYYDHVIRNREDYEAIAKYIEENPLRWEIDRLFTKDEPDFNR